MKILDDIATITERESADQIAPATGPLCDMSLTWSVTSDGQLQISGAGTDIYRLLKCHKNGRAVSLYQIVRCIDAEARKAALRMVRDLTNGKQTSILDIAVTSAEGGTHWLRVIGKSAFGDGGHRECAGGSLSGGARLQPRYRGSGRPVNTDLTQAGVSRQ